MSDDDYLDGLIRGWEQKVGRPITDPERAELAELAAEVSAVLSSQLELNRFREFIRRLAERQGTVMPNLKALYEYKSDLDRKLMGDKPDEPPAAQL
jgi:hypothetical protein